MSNLKHWVYRVLNPFNSDQASFDIGVVQATDVEAAKQQVTVFLTEIGVLDEEDPEVHVRFFPSLGYDKNNVLVTQDAGAETHILTYQDENQWDTDGL